MEISEIETQLADKPDVLAAVKEMHGKASRLTPEIEADLGNLTTLKANSAAVDRILKETGAKDVDGLLSDFNNIKTVKADLEKQKANWKASGKSTDSPEYRALEEQLNGLKGTVDTLTKEAQEAKDAASRAAAEKRETDLKSSITTAAAKNKATDPDDIYILLKAKGMVGHGEDGAPFFRKANEKGELVAVTSAEEAVASLAARRKDLFAGSGMAGTGTDHRGKGGEPETKVTAEGSRRAFLDSRSKK